jgi:hypothetical protein
MTIDDPVTALKKRFEFEDASAVPFVQLLLSLLSTVAGELPIGLLETLRAKDEQHRITVMLDTLSEEIRRLNANVNTILDGRSPDEQERTARVVVGLVTDGIRKASATRSEERVKRIATILAHGLAALKTEEADEIDEMMRIAMELTERDVDYLRQLVHMEGSIVRTDGRINRYEAYQRWESSDLKRVNSPDVEGTYAKLESYGLVWRLPSQNNMNVMADIMNQYGLLAKGLRFVDLISRVAEGSEAR